METLWTLAFTLLWCRSAVLSTECHIAVDNTRSSFLVQGRYMSPIQATVEQDHLQPASLIGSLALSTEGPCSELGASFSFQGIVQVEDTVRATVSAGSSKTGVAELEFVNAR
eukprot:scaffold212167_cov14-Tisochrysis_lutea.AAC.1